LPRSFRTFLPALLLGLLTGCSAGLPPETAARLERLPSLQVTDVPLYAQQQHQCGPAALAMVLGWGGEQLSPSALSPEVFSPTRQGSLQPAMVAAARRHGRAAYEITGLDALLTELEAGHPVIVLENLGLDWWPRWHYSVVVGASAKGEALLLYSGRDRGELVPLDNFRHTWDRGGDWGLLVLPPARLPASQSESAVLAGLAALEAAGQSPAAAAGYAAMAKRWPENLPVRIGWANCLYADGLLPAAEQVLAEACRRFPDAGVVWNNRAQVLFELGRREEALQAAERAVSLGGPLRDVFRATRDDIRTSPAAH